MIVKPRAPRFYLWRNGEIIPCYETGKKNGGVKPYSLKEARVDRALPSVTTVLSVIDRPQLNDSRVTKAIHSALTLPRLPGETEDVFAERVLEDSEAQSAKAAEFGTRIHDAIADLLNRPHIPTKMEGIVSAELRPYLESFHQWALDNIDIVRSVERCVGDPMIGTAGRMDLDCNLKDKGPRIIDFKTQDIKNGKPKFWDSWPLQLAAYNRCVMKEGIRGITSVIIPSNEPGLVHVQHWDGWGHYYDMFEHALELWIYGPGRGYDPRQQ